MKNSLLVIGFAFLFIVIIMNADARKEKDLHISSLDIKFNKTDAIFTVNFDFDEISRTFLFIFGSKSIEPKIKYLFPNYDYDIIKLDPDKAILRVKNISRLAKGYYLHDSIKFGETIGTVYISDPTSKKTRKYDNLNETPNYFYRS